MCSGDSWNRIKRVRETETVSSTGCCKAKEPSFLVTLRGFRNFMEFLGSTSKDHLCCTGALWGMCSWSCFWTHSLCGAGFLASSLICPGFSSPTTNIDWVEFAHIHWGVQVHTAPQTTKRYETLEGSFVQDLLAKQTRPQKELQFVQQQDLGEKQFEKESDNL